MTVTTLCLKEPKNTAYSAQWKCLEPLIAVVNLFVLGYESDHFMLERRNIANSPQLKCLEPLIAVVNLLLLGYDIDHIMLERTKNMADSP